jgi:hypothetical protein
MGIVQKLRTSFIKIDLLKYDLFSMIWHEQRDFLDDLQKVQRKDKFLICSEFEKHSEVSEFTCSNATDLRNYIKLNGSHSTAIQNTE